MSFFPVTGDLKLADDGSDFVIVSDAEALATDMRVSAQTILGTYYFDLNEGVDYGSVLGQVAAEDALRIAVLSWIKQFPEITNTRYVGVSVDEDRKATTTFSVDTIYGTLNSALEL